MKKIYCTIFSYFTFFGLSYAQCPAGQLEVSIDVVTDQFGYEAYWELVPAGDPCGTNTIFAGGNTNVGCAGGGAQNQSPGGYGDNLTINEGPWCLIDGNDYTIHFIDDWGDGGTGFNVDIGGYPLFSFLGETTNEAFTFTVEMPDSFDLSMTSLNIFPYMFVGNNTISGVVTNVGSQTITSFDLNYAVNGGSVVNETITGVSVAPFTTYAFTHSTNWSPSSTGMYDVDVWTSMPNGNPDGDASNDSLAATVEVGPGVPNIIDAYLATAPVLTVIGNSSDDVDTPRDLDFHPVLSRSELWVINKETENTGGTTVTFSNAGKAGQTSILKQDGNAWHFMSLPTGIAFSRTDFFATSPGVFDANHDGGAPFTGPSLWTSDPAIYAQPSGGNGSHMDMLHESPNSQGIAHEVDNVYWVVDGYNNDVVRYDFVEDHGPGNGYHGDAIIRRYADFSITKDPSDHIVSHCVLDKNTNWLYVVDHGGQRVLRLDVTTGTVGGTPSFGPNEAVVEYQMVTGYTWEVVIDSGLVAPAGIEVMDNRLLVSDYTTGDIIVYDISGASVAEMGRIQAEAGIMGIKVGPHGHIWYVNATKSEVVRVDGWGVGVSEPSVGLDFALYPNPTNDAFHIDLSGNIDDETVLDIMDATGKLVYSRRIDGGQNRLIIDEGFSSGLYTVSIRTGYGITTKRLVVK